jgi:hypothetical protein
LKAPAKVPRTVCACQPVALADLADRRALGATQHPQDFGLLAVLAGARRAWRVVRREARLGAGDRGLHRRVVRLIGRDLRVAASALAMILVQLGLEGRDPLRVDARARVQFIAS